MSWCLVLKNVNSTATNPNIRSESKLFVESFAADTNWAWSLVFYAT